MNEFYVALAVLSLGLALVIFANRRQHSVPHRAPETLPNLVVRKPIHDPSGLRLGLLAGLQAAPPSAFDGRARAIGGATRLPAQPHTAHIPARGSSDIYLGPAPLVAAEPRRRSPLLTERNRIFTAKAPPQLLQPSADAGQILGSIGPNPKVSEGPTSTAEADDVWEQQLKQALEAELSVEASSDPRLSEPEAASAEAVSESEVSEPSSRPRFALHFEDAAGRLDEGAPEPQDVMVSAALGRDFEHALSQPDRDALAAEGQPSQEDISNQPDADASFEEALSEPMPLAPLLDPSPAEASSTGQTAHAPQAALADETADTAEQAKSAWREYSALPDETAVVEGFDPLHDILELPAQPMLAEYVQSGYLLTFEDGQNLLLVGLKESEPPPLWEVRPTQSEGAQLIDP